MQANPWLQIDLGAVVDVSKVTIVGKAAGAQLAPNVKAPAYTAKHTFTVRIGNKKLKAVTAVDKRCGVVGRGQASCALGACTCASCWHTRLTPRARLPACSAAVCATLKGALKTAPGSTLPCGATVGGKFVPSTRRGRYITIDLTPPRTPKNKPGSERLVVAEVTAIAKGEACGSGRPGRRDAHVQRLGGACVGAAAGWGGQLARLVQHGMTRMYQLPTGCQRR